SATGVTLTASTSASSGWTPGTGSAKRACSTRRSTPRSLPSAAIAHLIDAACIRVAFDARRFQIGLPVQRARYSVANPYPDNDAENQACNEATKTDDAKLVDEVIHDAPPRHAPPRSRRLPVAP